MTKYDEDEVPNPTLTHVDSLVVLNSHNYVNDCEEHEGQPHLKDFFRLKSNDNKQGSEQVEKKSGISRSCISIPQNRKEENRQVSFHEVTVREYEMILGDNPCPSFGPPVSLGWNYQEYQPLDVNRYEYHHSKRRTLQQLGLNHARRKEILFKNGYNISQINAATKEKNRIRSQRKRSAQSVNRPLVIFKIEEAYNCARRKLMKRIVRRKGDDQSVSTRNTSTSSIAKS